MLQNLPAGHSDGKIYYAPPARARTDHPLYGLLNIVDALKSYPFRHGYH